MKLRKVDDFYWTGFYSGYYIELVFDDCDRWSIKCFEHEDDWRSVFGCHAGTRREVVEAVKYWTSHYSNWCGSYKSVFYTVTKVKNGWEIQSSVTKSVIDRSLRKALNLLGKEIRNGL